MPDDRALRLGERPPKTSMDFRSAHDVSDLPQDDRGYHVTA
jgi:hypothetical protein